MKNRGFSEKMLQFLENTLKEQKPGLDAQLEMMPHPRPGHKLYSEVEDTCVKAGVLILLYPWNDQLHIVFTRRTDRVDFHQAQISFPGGRQEEDESFKEAALREAHEEVNIPPDSVRILGELTPLYVPPSNYCIYPVVAVAKERPDFQPSELEVAEVIEVPLDHLLDLENIQREMWHYKGEDIEVPYYFFKGDKIWGATAMILAELLEMLKGFMNK